jgi:hypothetical protein
LTGSGSLCSAKCSLLAYNCPQQKLRSTRVSCFWSMEDPIAACYHPSQQAEISCYMGQTWPGTSLGRASAGAAALKKVAATPCFLPHPWAAFLSLRVWVPCAVCQAGQQLCGHPWGQQRLRAVHRPEVFCLQVQRRAQVVREAEELPGQVLSLQAQERMAWPSHVPMLLILSGLIRRTTSMRYIGHVSQLLGRICQTYVGAPVLRQGQVQAGYMASRKGGRSRAHMN